MAGASTMMKRLNVCDSPEAGWSISTDRLRVPLPRIVTLKSAASLSGVIRTLALGLPGAATPVKPMDDTARRAPSKPSRLMIHEPDRSALSAPSKVCPPSDDTTVSVGFTARAVYSAPASITVCAKAVSGSAMSSPYSAATGGRTSAAMPASLPASRSTGNR